MFQNYFLSLQQNNGRVPLFGNGVSPFGRVVRFVATLFSWKYFQPHNLSILLKNIRLNNIKCKIYLVRVKHISC